MENKFRYLIKNMGVLFVSNFSSKILVFLLVPLYTSILTTKEYGIYDLVYTSIQLLLPILSLNITDGVMRYFMDVHTDNKQTFSIAVRFLSFSVGLVGILLLLNYVFGVIKSIHGIELIIFIYYVAYGYNNLVMQTAKGLEEINYTGIAGIIGTFSMLIFNIFFLCFVKCGIVGFFVANILGQAIPAIYLSLKIKVFKYIERVIDIKLKKEMLTYSIPLLFTAVGWWINNAADKYIVTFFCGVDNNGLLSVSYKIPAILNTVQGIFIQAWQVSAIREYDAETTDDFYKISFFYLNAIVCLSCSFLMIYIKYIAGLLFAKDFYEAWIFVPFLLMSSVFNSAAGFIGPILSAKKDTRTMAYSAVLSAISNIVLNLILVNVIGVQGAVIATAISSLLMYTCRRKAVVNMISDNKEKLIWLAWMVLILEGVFVIRSFNNTYLIVCFLIIFVIFREVLINFMKKIYNKVFGKI